METEPQTTPALPEGFEQLPMARPEMPEVLSGVYRVYHDAKNYTSIQASSALEALEQSGLRSAIRIERESLHNINLLTPNFTGKASAEFTPSSLADEPTEQQTPAADTLAGAPLSNNDIDALLNSNPTP